jgi:hypothetical protein
MRSFVAAAWLTRFPLGLGDLGRIRKPALSMDAAIQPEPVFCFE